MEEVILVDENDNPVGLMEKMEAHRSGSLHRAFSVFLYNSNGEILLQQRSAEKYHSGNLWTNACCSHPRPNESTVAAANRRLQEELGLKTELTEILHFIYKARLDNELTEHELDHVFIGICDATPNPDPQEVKDWKYINSQELITDITNSPEKYTVWFRTIYNKVQEYKETKP